MSAKKRLEFSRSSIADIESIKQYISTVNPRAAERVINRMIKVADHLVDFPMLGRIGRKAGTREIIVPEYPYLLVYRLTASKVIIVTVAHQPKKHL